uniref:Tr-type G domain-containing protein n=1 Tax=Proboscia inermis TaxID=420281 RepID=A0A7S0CLT5_9STRA|mmetsp:Transcript_6938/g.7108  ORF Transcript_6938/g.7108 Transcript_6938/m.7108 type:complete len:142 (+) Transcript_6938:258-683(+)
MRNLPLFTFVNKMDSPGLSPYEIMDQIIVWTVNHFRSKLSKKKNISGFRSALKAAVPFLKKNMVISVTELSDENLVNAAKTSMSSKILGKEADFFARMAVDAVKSVKMKQSQAEQFIDEGSGSNRDGSAKAEADPKKDLFK